MKAEILAVISRYVDVDSEKVDIALEQRNRDSLIVAEIPFLGNTSQDEARRRLGQEAAANNTPKTDAEDD